MLNAVITTIQEPTAAVQALAEALGSEPEALIVVGDRKGPARFELEGCAFLDLEQQGALPFVLAPLLYLPSHCCFRMTDIWRSFIAQRCLWELGHWVVCQAPELELELVDAWLNDLEGMASA